MGNAGDIITDTVTAQGTDDEGNPVEGEDDEEVLVVEPDVGARCRAIY